MFKKITTGLVKNENGVIVDIFRSRSTMGCEISGQKYLLYIDNEKIGEKNVSRINLLSARKQQEFFSAECGYRTPSLPMKLLTEMAGYISEAFVTIGLECRFEDEWYSLVQGK